MSRWFHRTVLFLTGAVILLTALPAWAVSAPTVTGTSPSAAANTAPVTITISGTEFQQGASAILQPTGQAEVPDQPDIPGTGEVVTSAESMQATFDIRAAAPGAYVVRVENLDGGAGECSPACFTVTAAPPTVASITPARRQQNSTGDHTVTGTNFAHGAAVAFNPSTGITINSTTFGSTTQLLVNISVAAGAPTTARDVIVENTDGQGGSCNDCFTVTERPGAPTVLATMPDDRGQGARNQNIQIFGLGFAQGAVASFACTDPCESGITVNSTTFVNMTQVVANIDIAPAPADDTGAYTVTVTNPGGASDPCNSPCFTVNPGPIVDSVSPTAASNTGGIGITIFGSNFVDGAQAVLEHDEQPDIAGQNEEVAEDGNSMSAGFDLTAVAPGEYDVRVTNPDAGSNACASCFTVGAAAPTVTGVNPASLPRGATNQNLTITGTNFAQGADASFTPSTGITVNSTTFDSTTQVTANVTISPSAPAGARNVTVTNTDDQSGVCVGCFTVTDPDPGVTPPTVTSASPNFAARGVSGRNITVSGSGFNPGVSVQFSDSGVTANSVARNSSSSLTVNISVASNAAPGLRSITATNTDGGSGTCAGCFRVIAFDDVPPGHFAFTEVEKIAAAGITGGCATNPARYCPNSRITRGQMSVFMLKAMGHGDPSHLPAYRGIFADVPSSHPFARYIEHLFDHGVTAGCATRPRRYCPSDPVTRGQMSVFLLRANGHAGHLPPYRGIFADVPSSHPFARFIEHLFDHGITAGCDTSPRRYCPSRSVSRAEMAIFIVRAFGL